MGKKQRDGCDHCLADANLRGGWAILPDLGVCGGSCHLPIP